MDPVFDTQDQYGISLNQYRTLIQAMWQAQHYVENILNLMYTTCDEMRTNPTTPYVTVAELIRIYNKHKKYMEIIGLIKKAIRDHVNTQLNTAHQALEFMNYIVICIQTMIVLASNYMDDLAIFVERYDVNNYEQFNDINVS